MLLDTSYGVESWDRGGTERTVSTGEDSTCGCLGKRSESH